jgi:CRP-like cAMP-binding protein
VCIDHLKRLPAFAQLPLSTLESLAADARCVRLPAGRWLVRPGRALSDHYYLLRGRVRIHGGRAAAVVAGGSPLAREPVYPGALGIETLTPAEFLRLSGDRVPLAATPAALGVPDVQVDAADWQTRFLLSPLLQRLEPAAWQRLLRAMTQRHHEAGEQLIAAGDPADCCYVLCAGGAEVRDADGRLLAALAPGSLFGEDALISGATRNASVRACSAGATVSLPAERFEALLLNMVVRRCRDLHGRCVITLDRVATAGQIRVPAADIRTAARSLSRERAYAIVGGAPRERVLAAFLLAQFGIDAEPAG